MAMIRLAWRATHIFLAIVGVMALAVWFSGKLAVLVLVASAFTLGLIWFLIFRILTALSRFQRASGKTILCALARRTRGRASLHVAKRFRRSGASASPAGTPLEARPEITSTISRSHIRNVTAREEARWRFVRIDDNGDPIFKWELPGEA